VFTYHGRYSTAKQDPGQLTCGQASCHVIDITVGNNLETMAKGMCTDTHAKIT